MQNQLILSFSLERESKIKSKLFKKLQEVYCSFFFTVLRPKAEQTKYIGLEPQKI